MENIFVEFLPPWVETGLQPAFYDKESGTVLQQTARMYARVNMLIRMFNKLSKNTKETVENYINQFNELHDYVHDYFDNLDVQEEINNKLDDMSESGELQEIIAQYLTLASVLSYPTVADLGQATNLDDGSKAMCYGYLRLGDGVYNLYSIREATESDVIDGYNIVSIVNSDNLVGERLQNGEEVVIRLETTDSIQPYLNIEAKKTIILPANTTITVNDVLFLNSDTEIDLNGSTIFFDYARPTSLPLVDWDETLGFMGYGPTSTFTQYEGYKNITIRNGVIKGGCSCFMHTTNVLFEDVEFTTILSRHAIQFAGCYGVTIRRCVFNGTKHQEGVEHSSECINLDPCEYGGQPYVADTSPIYDHTANQYFRIESNTFQTPNVQGQLYGCAVGSHSADSTGTLLCENFVATDNSFGAPYADTLNITDYNQVTISNNSVNFSTTSHEAHTYFVHCRGGLKEMTITNNIVNNVGQFIYTDRATRDRKDLLIEGNAINAIDVSGYAVIHLFHYENTNIQHNTIKCQRRALHIAAIYSGSTIIEGTESVNANFKYNEVTTTTSGSDVYLRFQDVQGCQIIGNVINYINTFNNASEYTLALQGTTTDAIVMHNRSSDPKHFVNINSISDKFQYNNAQYRLTSASGTSQSGTLASALVNFSKLKLQLGATTYTQVVELLPWLIHNRNKFYWGEDESRTYKFAVVTEAGQLGTGSLTINNDNTYSYTGDVTLRSIYAYD